MRRTIVNIIMIILAFALQTAIFPFVPYISAVPNLMLINVFTIAFAYGEVEGVLYGLLCGILLDTTSSSAFGYYTLIFVWVGYMNGAFSKYYYDEYLFLPLTMCAINEFVYNLYIFVAEYLLTGEKGFFAFLKAKLLPDVVLTIIFTLLLYRLLLAINRGLKKRDEAMKGPKFAQ